jgi:hypothetical protein
VYILRYTCCNLWLLNLSQNMAIVNQSLCILNIEGLGVRVMVFNATLNNISVISWRSVLLVEEITVYTEKVTVNLIGGGNNSTWRKPPTCRKSLTNLITQCCIEYSSPWAGFELVALVMIDIDCTRTGSCKSNYHTITTRTTPLSNYPVLSFISWLPNLFGDKSQNNYNQMSIFLQKHMLPNILHLLGKLCTIYRKPKKNALIYQPDTTTVRSRPRRTL